MRTVVVGPRPVELDALIARRQKLGLDLLDEVWQGDYHMNAAPAGPHAWLDQQLAELLGPPARRVGLYGSGIFNLGTPWDFRVPDRGLHRVRPVATWFDTAAVVVEIESPGDETWDKLGFYAAHGVDEVLIVSGAARSVTWLSLADGTYRGTVTSRLLGEASAEIPAAIEWPEAGPPSE